MKVNGQVVVVTGGGNGIGKALCQVFHDAGAAHVVVADTDLAAAERVATQIKGSAIRCDVASENDVSALVADTESTFGPIGLFCSNAVSTSDFKGRPTVSLARRTTFGRGVGMST